MLPYQLELPFERVSDYQGNWIVEASTAGLVAGEWPNTIHVSGPNPDNISLIIDKTFGPRHCINYVNADEVESVTYLCKDDGTYLIILND